MSGSRSMADRILLCFHTRLHPAHLPWTQVPVVFISALVAACQNPSPACAVQVSRVTLTQSVFLHGCRVGSSVFDGSATGKAVLTEAGTAGSCHHCPSGDPLLHSFALPFLPPPAEKQKSYSPLHAYILSTYTMFY